MNKASASRWMAVSGFCGLSFFIIANFTDIFNGLDVIAGLLQIVMNLFVFITWRRGFQQYSGFKKAFAGIGMVWPIGMATITICRVLLPALVQAIH